MRAYYQALEKISQFASPDHPISELQIRYLHALVTAGYAEKVKLSSYRNVRQGSNDVNYSTVTQKEISQLMQGLLTWLVKAEQEDIPCPLRAAIVYQQIIAIQPFA